MKEIEEIFKNGKEKVFIKLKDMTEEEFKRIEEIAKKYGYKWKTILYNEKGISIMFIKE